MIGRIDGILAEKHAPQVLVDVGGIGYELDVSMQTFCLLPPLGEAVRLYTQLVVREDAHLLYGFAAREERAAFRQLVKIGGIGAKTALGILSAMSADELAQTIAQEDVKRLSSVPGIGKKTAERMVLELRGKLAPVASVAAAAGGNEDVFHTLIALGYSEREAQNAVKHLPPTGDVGEGVRLALKTLLK
ncbi:Holliday junction branch migration protein RuvA [Conchiformibius kuhniae]|uniref:Holliday junction branch migration complex subunit RuvA n=1 Tax=Conchiformibius kuhniae TaxID=211502 RepID=A0A8T9N122_9NEIS|nr:Holliday junction branch migration protein RuvA [Conchiformibius kuhniae]UOP05683.1 Holliday junction branch migration protein RuvA [Conchiformibius kuhniae]